MLRWADGQSGRRSWPSIAERGPLLSAAGCAQHYRLLREVTEVWQWNPLWLPIAHEGWGQAGVEMTVSPGVVLSVDWGDPDVNVVTPSLVAMLQATADMVEAGLAPDCPVDPEGHGDWLARRWLILDGRDDWVRWPYDRRIASDVDGWPPHWRVAAGLPPETDAPHPPAVPIRSVLDGASGQSEPAVVEGYVTDRVLIDGQASGNSVIAIEDATGTVRVLVQPDTVGSYWAAWVGRRIQVDVLAGLAARHQIDEVLDAEPHRRSRAPVGDCVLAVAVRMAVQTTPSGQSDR